MHKRILFLLRISSCHEIKSCDDYFCVQFCLRYRVWCQCNILLMDHAKCHEGMILYSDMEVTYWS